MTIRNLKKYVSLGLARDITFNDISNEFARSLRTVDVAIGTYGVNGGLFEDRNGERYVITQRSSALYRCLK